MSQSLTFYRVSEDVFNQLQNSVNKLNLNISSVTKNYATVQGTFMALEYILSKGQNPSTIETVNEVFNPTKSLGADNFDNMTPEEQMTFYENGGFLYYLNQETVFKFNELLASFTESDFHEKYSSKELNANFIYPEVWHDDNSPNQAYNERHILDDAAVIRSFFKDAATDEDYVFVLGG